MFHWHFLSSIGHLNNLRLGRNTKIAAPNYNRWHFAQFCRAVLRNQKYMATQHKSVICSIGISTVLVIWGAQWFKQPILPFCSSCLWNDINKTVLVFQVWALSDYASNSRTDRFFLTVGQWQTATTPPTAQQQQHLPKRTARAATTKQQRAATAIPTSSIASNNCNNNDSYGIGFACYLDPPWNFL